MTFADQVLVRLADPATRAGVFDTTSLEQIAGAAYDTSRASFSGPFSAIFDDLELGMLVPTTGTAEGHWGLLGGSDRNGGNFTISGLGGAPLVADAFWKGFVVARVTAPTGRITSVEVDWPDVGAIDRAIVLALGALPSDPAVRDQERRTRLIAQLKAGAAQDDVVTSALVDRLIAATGAGSLNAFFDRYTRAGAFGPVQVTISEGPPAPPLPKPLPIAAAIVIRDAAAGLAQLLADSRMLRTQLQAAGLGRAEAAGLPQRHALVVIWVLPASVFQDAAWPGADEGARRAAAGQWLAREGIGLAVTA